MASDIRWGILGTGSIARKFAQGLHSARGAQFAAVGSRSLRSAEAFADLFACPRKYGSYEALTKDESIDVVYIATPHSHHYENARLCLEAGRAVLCEKPFTINALQAEDLIALSRTKQLFLMEAMWTRFLPALVKVRQLLEEDAIGEVLMLMADFGYRANFNPTSRMFNPVLGGGALLDVGVYSVSLAFMVLGVPESITSAAHVGKTGVDELCSLTLKYSSGGIAVLTAANRLATPQTAVILGTKGRIWIDSPWFVSTRIRLEQYGKMAYVIETPYLGNGYNYEIEEVGDCLQRGALESPVMPLDETLAIMKVMDEARRSWGVIYPGETGQ